jgi:hypothetical protein
MKVAPTVEAKGRSGHMYAPIAHFSPIFPNILIAGSFPAWQRLLATSEDLRQMKIWTSLKSSNTSISHLITPFSAPIGFVNGCQHYEWHSFWRLSPTYNFLYFWAQIIKILMLRLQFLSADNYDVWLFVVMMIANNNSFSRPISVVMF